MFRALQSQMFSQNLQRILSGLNPSPATAAHMPSVHRSDDYAKTAGRGPARRRRLRRAPAYAAAGIRSTWF